MRQYKVRIVLEEYDDEECVDILDESARTFRCADKAVKHFDKTVQAVNWI